MARVPKVSPRSLAFVLCTTVIALTLGVARPSSVQTPAQPPQPSMKTPAAAQATPAPPTFLLLTLVDVKPDMMADYVALQKNETIPTLQKGGVEWRDAWRTGAFGTNYTFAFVAPIKSFADMDAPNPIEKALGEEGARAYMAKIAKLVNGSRRYALRMRPDLGYKPEGVPMPKLAILASVEVVSGRTMEYEGLLKTDWAPALKKAGVPMYLVSQVVMGGSVSEYYTLTPLENYGQLDKGHPIQQTLGETGLNKLMARMGPSVHHAERSIIRYDEELSFKTKPMSQVR